ncbi:cystatin-A-like [Patagioenas fasciata]|uniref:cystatin-A-like n=1 Tax=Patagioenas fasciata TaxID=372321 RepID=UPI003A99F529
MPITGGLTETEPATPEVQKIVDQVKLQFESRVNGTFKIFKAIEYRTQVVAGTNYFIKVQNSDDDYTHLRVFVGLSSGNDCPTLVSFQTGKTRDDPLTYF